MKDKTLPKLRQSWFLEAVKSLKLESPGTDIAEKTGYTRGSVSNYLNSKRLITDDFLKTFCESYGYKYEDVKKELETKTRNAENDNQPITSTSHPNKGKAFAAPPMMEVNPGPGFVTQKQWDDAPNIAPQETMGSTLAKIYSPVGLGSLYVLGAMWASPLSPEDVEKMLGTYQNTAKLVYMTVRSIYELDAGAVSWTKKEEVAKKENKKREKQEA